MLLCLSILLPLLLILPLALFVWAIRRADQRLFKTFSRFDASLTDDEIRDELGRGR